MEAFLLIFGGGLVLVIVNAIVTILAGPSPRDDAWARNHAHRARR